jgi:hypothetical protein
MIAHWLPASVGYFFIDIIPTLLTTGSIAVLKCHGKPGLLFWVVTELFIIQTDGWWKSEELWLSFATCDIRPWRWGQMIPEISVIFNQLTRLDLREIGWDGVDWIGLIWLRIRTSGGLLWTRYWIFGFHKMLEVLEWLHNWRLLKKGSAPWVSN